MPPAISDGEEASDIDFDAPAPVTKKTNRDKKRTSYKDEEPEELKTEDIPAAEEEDGEDDEDGGEDDEEEEEEDVYVVEKILSHVVQEDVSYPTSLSNFDMLGCRLTPAQGTLKFEVKWEGYEKKSDRTWEPEENLVYVLLLTTRHSSAYMVVQGRFGRFE
jgi:chromobox protein 1